MYEINFISFAALLGIMTFPFAIIFLILVSLNWNQRKSLFSDSWFVYLAWIFFGLLTMLAGLILDNEFFITETAPIMTAFYLSIIIVQAFGIAAVLCWRSRQKNLPSLIYMSEVIPDAPQSQKIWKTAFLISILTFLMVLGLVIALEDIDSKINPRNNNVSFGIYDD